MVLNKTTKFMNQSIYSTQEIYNSTRPIVLSDYHSCSWNQSFWYFGGVPWTNSYIGNSMGYTGIFQVFGGQSTFPEFGSQAEAQKMVRIIISAVQLALRS